jgi:hypothetical protein
MAQLFYKTKEPWEILREEGATLLVAGALGPMRLEKTQKPNSKVIGIDLMELKERYLTTWTRQFVKEKRRVKECYIQGMLPLIAD